MSSPRLALWLSVLALNFFPTAGAAPLTITTSLLEARSALAALKARGTLPTGGVILEITGGVYALTSSLALTAADGGTAAAARWLRGIPSLVPPSRRACPSPAAPRCAGPIFGLRVSLILVRSNSGAVPVWNYFLTATA